MELRYNKQGDHYLPQYKRADNGEWETFIEGNLPVGSTIRRVAQALVNIDEFRSGGWGSDIEGIFYYTKTKEVYFKKKIYVMSFLGAAKVYFSEEKEEFNL